MFNAGDVPSHAHARRGARRARWPRAAPASAKVVEVGRTDAAPACPASPCLAVSRTTGYQIKVGDERGSFIVPEDGKIVAWSIALGKPTAEQIDVLQREPRRPGRRRG